MTVGESVSILDIGGDTGALVLYTGADRDGDEIDIVDLGRPGQRTHSQVHRRTANGRELWAAVYPSLPAGRYGLQRAADAVADTVTIRGGTVTELDWRSSASSSGPPHRNRP
jgi:hypothetical protein